MGETFVSEPTCKATQKRFETQLKNGDRRMGSLERKINWILNLVIATLLSIVVMFFKGCVG